MTRLRPRAEKAESLFVENLKPFSTASTLTGRWITGIHNYFLEVAVASD
jgi:hypothetical protein